MRQHPLALTDRQLALVLDHAKLVQHQWRDRYLADIADQLLVLDRIADHDVQEAIRHALDRMGLAA